MNEIHTMLCDLSVDKCADISLSDFQKFELKNRDVLFNRTNSFAWVGRTGIYYQNDEIKKTFASYLVRFNPDENIILPDIQQQIATLVSESFALRGESERMLQEAKEMVEREIEK